MQNYLIRNISIVNEGKTVSSDLLIKNGRIEKIATGIKPSFAVTEINGEGKYLLPGAIDDQVHFREPGLTHKATIYTEARAAVAGGITSFMEMPNTVPPAFTQDLLEQKYARAANSSLANYSFYMGTSNENADEALRTNDKRRDICGIKIFMGSSTGNLLVDNYLTLDKLFRESGVLIATHCEDEKIIRRNLERLKKENRELRASDHPVIRDEEACFESSLTAIQFAKKYDSRLHIFHLSTEKEMQLFSNLLPLAEKRITAEVCVHHLHFTSDDYAVLGNRIKCNPAIKAPHNREALWKALLDDRLDLIATDHAPHTLEEKGLVRNPDGTLSPAGGTADGTHAYEHAHAG
ncbi:MAG TPA: amidohydrolase family protein, partial [Puia sp.]|nr:amidohydrolase family protein [Puia sp.]